MSFDQVNGLFELLQFEWSTEDSSLYRVHLSPLDVIKQLGVPSYFGAHVETYGSADFGGVWFLLVYQSGVVFSFFYDSMTLATTPTDNPAIQNSQVEICLDAEETKPQSNIGAIIGQFFLMSPLPNDLKAASPIQSSVVNDLIELQGYVPVQDVFGMSPADITAKATQNEPLCLDTTISH